jgi:nucleoid-associated protein YgaU
MRYSDIPSKLSDNKRRVTRSVIYPPIARKQSDIYVRTTIGDRIEMLAFKYYGNVNMWWLIAEANAVGKGSFAIPAGTLLRIPIEYQDVLDEYVRLNK